MEVINLKGEKEPFSFEKVFQSAKRAGASSVLAKEIAQKIEKFIYPNIQTKEIYTKVKQLLKQKDKRASFRFSLRKAMAKLGPSGFPFEKYIAEIFASHNFKVKLNQKIKGKYARHEIDFIAQKDRAVYIGECKFRHHRGERIDLNTILAVYARFLDLRQGKYFHKFSSYQLKPIIVTNAKFSGQAKNYAKGVGIELLGWRYPKNNGLEKMIEKEGLYPITILPGFKGFLKDIFASEKLMLAKDVFKYSPAKLSQKLGISKAKLVSLINQAQVLLRSPET